jgi:N-methylhydantoinase A
MGLAIGIDAGGTFTDLMARDADTGATYSYKLPSTPTNPANAIVRGIEELLELNGLSGGNVELVAHGTTVGTNTLLQRSGARINLVTTKGFRDLLEIGRQTRPLNYDMHTDFPPPLVPRHRRIELSERIGACGEIVAPIAEDDLERVVAEVLAQKPEAVAVCFLFSYLNPQHELEVKRSIQLAAPDLFISASSEVQAEFREYERISTTALNAYLQPVMARYFDTLRDRLKNALPDTHIAISRSNGGLMSLALARAFPIRTALSGPAAGVIGAIEVQRGAGRPNAITFDMGGTSADVALVQNYGCNYRHRSVIGGFPIRLAVLDIHTVGAGGGSIAWFDKDDLLKVGPRSAGADPGPACYGLGGTEPTVSDANLLLGRLPPEGLLGGRMRLVPDLALRAVSRVADALGLTAQEAARGIIDIVTSNMIRAIRVITVERGFDPRDFTLIAFGGAGPLHARQVAAELGISEILVPEMPGILCAHGALASSFKEDIVRTTRRELHGTEDLAAIACAIRDLLEEARRWSEAENLTGAVLHHAVVLEARYVGQNFELPIPLLAKEVGLLPPLDEIRRRFFAEHERQYGFHAEDGLVEIVNVRVTVEVAGHAPIPHPPVQVRHVVPIPHGTRSVWFDEPDAIDTPVYARRSLASGDKLTGPAVIDQGDATTLLFPGDTLSVDDRLNLLIKVRP